MSFFRNFKLTDAAKLQFGAEFFNIFNHANLFVAGGTNNIDGNISNRQPKCSTEKISPLIQ